MAFAQNGGDEPFESFVRDMSANLNHNKSLLKKNFPHIYSQLKELNQAQCLKLWSSSTNFDYYAKEQIVLPQVSKLIESVSGDKLILQRVYSQEHQQEIEIVHAGLEHIYGYLFSVINTPYGKKRKRWIDGGFNTLLQLESAPLSTHTSENLLSNVTYFVSRIAKKMKFPAQEIERISPELREYNYDSLKKTTLVEVFRSQETNYQLTTYLIEGKQEFEGQSHILIYTISTEEEERVVSMFPIAPSFYDFIIEKKTGKVDDIQILYNGFIQELLLGENLTGERYLEK